MLTTRRGETPPLPSSVVEASAVDTDTIDRKQTEALRRLRRTENRLRAIQTEAKIIRGD